MQGLLKRKLPKLFEHFEGLGLHPTMYSAQWFITIFTYNFPFSVVVRIWDCFLLEGWKVVFRVALGLLKRHEGVLGCLWGGGHGVLFFYISVLAAQSAQAPSRCAACCAAFYGCSLRGAFLLFPAAHLCLSAFV
jgi:hypothetical protein